MLLPEPTPEQAADIVAIQQLAVSYSEAICRGEIEEAVLAYSADGVLASATTEDAIGHEAIAATIRAATSDFEFIFQTTHAGLVEVDRDEAWTRFPTTEWAKRRNGDAVQFLGVYEDRAVRTEHGWRFARRHLHGVALGQLDSFRRSRIHPLAAPNRRS